MGILVSHHVGKKRSKKSASNRRTETSYTKASPVKIIKSDGSVTVENSYSPVELQRIVKERAKVSLRTRIAMYKRDRGCCRYCHKPVTEKEWEPDHVVPISLGGSNKLSNLVVACISCNRRKGANVWQPRPIIGTKMGTN